MSSPRNSASPAARSVGHSASPLAHGSVEAYSGVLAPASARPAANSAVAG
jgi:hypothetical protein